MEHQYLHFTDRNSFHEWLEKNHNTCDGLWQVCFKKHTKKLSVSYDESVEEAICFGWIDSIIKRIDDQKYARKFTPRKDFTNWSDSNKRRARKMIELGKMTKEGLRKFKYDNNRKEKGKPSAGGIPQFFREAMSANQPALTNFLNLSQSNQNYYILWITDAKKEETKQRRLEEAINLLKENKKLGLK